MPESYIGAFPSGILEGKKWAEYSMIWGQFPIIATNWLTDFKSKFFFSLCFQFPNIYNEKI